MKVTCAWCGAVKQQGDGPVSHGICPVCAIVHFQLHAPALMAPLPDRYTDCRVCRESDLDDDGVATGCRVRKCVMPDRRDPFTR
jgi:predicted  nucleic acid-binding Zn-ribbon protein